MENGVDFFAKKVWDYHLLHQELKKADCLLVLGSSDLRVAEYAIKLFKEGWATFIIFSGGRGRMTKNLWKDSEAEVFGRLAVERGVPSERIIQETESTNTGENIMFTKKLFEERGIIANSFILVQKPYMERRSYVTFKKFWPGKDVIVTSPPISFEDYPDQYKSKAELISAIVGDLQRVKVYAERGWQIPQEVPKDVWEAYDKLVALGYTEQLIKD